MEHLLFYVGLACILTHEMDAIRCEEWTIFPGLARLDHQTGYVVFTALHVPLYAGLFWGLFANDQGVNQTLVTGVDIFFIIHVFLHLFMYRHPKNQFKSVFSWSVIIGAGMGGLLDLVIT